MTRLIPAFSLLLGASSLFAASATTAPTVELDPKLTAYTVVTGVAGTLNSKGSDTLGNLMDFWTKDFQRVYPSVIPQVESKGSGIAPPAITAAPVAQASPS